MLYVDGGREELQQWTIQGRKVSGVCDWQYQAWASNARLSIIMPALFVVYSRNLVKDRENKRGLRLNARGRRKQPVSRQNERRILLDLWAWLKYWLL